MSILVTHTSPDWDCITACWLLQRYGGMADAMVVFVNTGNPDPAVLAAADAVVDTGREYDLARLRFDHHQLPGSEANDDSAALLVYADVVNPQRVYWYLDPLVMLVFAGDTGKATHGADWSRQIGIHALLSAQKAKRMSNEALLAYGYAILDDLAEHLRAKAEARLTLSAYTVYHSADGLVRGLRDAPQGATFAAFEDGARLVVFTSTTPGTVSVGVMRGGENQEPHAGTLVAAVLAEPATDAAVRAELARWYRHEAGFFSGRGTAKAPDPTPLTADFVTLCRVLDAAWLR
jgi:hypothetical protein